MKELESEVILGDAAKHCGVDKRTFKKLAEQLDIKPVREHAPHYSWYAREDVLRIDKGIRKNKRRRGVAIIVED